MLNQMRNHASGWLASILFGILILSFALWGIKDVFNTGSNASAAATVGDKFVSPQEVYGRFYSHGPDGIVPLQQMQTVEQTLQESITDYLFAQSGRELGLEFDKLAVAKNIMADPLFQSDTGYNQYAYQTYLNTYRGITESEYNDEMRRVSARNLISGTIYDATNYPLFMAEYRYDIDNELRTAQTITIPYESIEVADPTDDSILQDYIEANADDYTIPESRSFILISPDITAMANAEPMSEEDLEAEYNRMTSAMQDDERRNFSRVTFSNLERAQNVYNLIETGKTLEEALQEAEAEGVTPVETGLISLGSLGTPELNEAAFSIELNKATEPTEQNFVGNINQYEILYLTDIVTGPPSLADMREDILNSYQSQKISNITNDLITGLQDIIAGGGTIEEAQTAYDLETIEITNINADGTYNTNTEPAHNPAENIEESQLATILETAFSLNNEENSHLRGLQNTDSPYILKITNITPATLSPLENVRDEALAAWKADEQKRIAAEKANNMLAQLNEGYDFTQLAIDNGLEAITHDPQKKSQSQEDGGLPAIATGMLFAARDIGNTITVPTNEGQMIIRLQEISNAQTLAEQDPARETMSNYYAQRAAFELAHQLTYELRQALTTEIKVNIRPQVLRQLENRFSDSP